MLLGLCLFIVLYELIRITKMKSLIEVADVLLQLKGDKEATNEFVKTNPKAVLFAVGETIYFITITTLLLTPLFKLGLVLLALTLINNLIKKYIQKNYLVYCYVDSVMCISATIISYQLIV